MPSHDRVNGDALVQLIDLLEDLPRHGGCEDLAVRMGTARELFDSLGPKGQRVIQTLLAKPSLEPVCQFLSESKIALFPAHVVAA